MNTVRISTALGLLGLALALGLALGLTAPAAFGQEIESLQRIESVAKAALRAQLPKTAQITAGSIDPRLRLPACTDEPATAPPVLRGSNATVTVRCTNPPWTVYVPLVISDLRPVVVLARSGARGDTLDSSLLVMQVRDIAKLPFGYFAAPEEVNGYELRRSLNAGAVLTPNDAEPPKLVRRGQSVTLIGRAGGLEVRAGGTALGDGAQGQRVKVRNNSSRRIVEGVVAADGSVEISL